MRRWRRVVVATAICAVPAGLLSPVAAADPAQNAPASQQAEAAEVPEATLQDKVRAASALGIVAGDDLLVLSDRNFVFELWNRAEGEEVRASAELALGDTDSDAACTAWIKNGIHEAVKRDQANELRDAEKARIARELKRNGAMVIGIEPTPEMLVLSYRDFIYELWERAEGDRVKAAALEAFGADEAAQKRFLSEGIREAHEQDQLDAIEEDEQASEEEKARQRARAAKDRAMRSVLGVVPTDGMLDLSDDNFIREVWDRAEPDTEVQAAAIAALRSSDPAVWKQFIEVGIYEADERDKANELREQEEADRKRVLEIKTWAENSLVHPGLAHAAQTALDAGPAEVSRFLRYGQYNNLVQSLRADTRGMRGWYIRHKEDDSPVRIHPGEPVPAQGVGADANWRVLRGLADPDCHSFEVDGRPGVYLTHEDLRVKALPSDGSDQFRANATWCSRTGLHGGGVSLEAFSEPGRFLRHIDGQVWVANDSGEHWFDKSAYYEADASWRVMGANPVSTGILLRWLNDTAIRERLGGPQDVEQADGDVRWRVYERGRMYWTSETGARQIAASVLEKYLELGGHKGGFGVPETDHRTTPDGIGRYNHFSKYDTSIYWSPDTGAHLIQGAIRKKWADLGWEKGILGYPITDMLTASDGVGRYNDFDRPDGGSIYWSPNSGAHAVWGEIRDKWSALGRATSRLGYPVAEQSESQGVLTQRFQGGRIEHNKETGQTTVHYD
ncbi:AbfB domain-containing protein [Amycolatopsis aidingensis]|uniref:AbfB domain-containing protein n=1 Tax=Amycolatopsis aidingensis TaxID=2842453 RepID=UPI001C0B6EB0|nr:AbfB domain-containing protein [Amycolatopsis aidingensis]